MPSVYLSHLNTIHVYLSVCLQIYLLVWLPCLSIIHRDVNHSLHFKHTNEPVYKWEDWFWWSRKSTINTKSTVEPSFKFVYQIPQIWTLVFRWISEFTTPYKKNHENNDDGNESWRTSHIFSLFFLIRLRSILKGKTLAK